MKAVALTVLRRVRGAGEGDSEGWKSLVPRARVSLIGRGEGEEGEEEGAVLLFSSSLVGRGVYEGGLEVMLEVRRGRREWRSGEKREETRGQGESRASNGDSNGSMTDRVKAKGGCTQMRRTAVRRQRRERKERCDARGRGGKDDEAAKIVEEKRRHSVANREGITDTAV